MMLIAAIACNATQGSGGTKREKVEATNAIYHWKGVYNPTAEEAAFMDAAEEQYEALSELQRRRFRNRR